MEVMQNTLDLESLLILESDEGFLVGGSFGGETVEVKQSEAGLTCQCFIAKVSPDGECEHTRAVLEYLAHVPGEDDRPNLSQADADYYLSKLAELDAIQTGNEASMLHQKERIDLWFESESSKIQRRKDYYILALDNWMHLSEYSTKQLVNGTLKVRAQQPEIIVTDESAVVKDGRFTRVIPAKQSVDKASLRKHITTTGEEPEGVKVTMRPHKFSYTTNRKEEA
ncbi:MAG: hypothetical protein HN995_12915 [Candidatus Marinimicrobia bacterium]|jgi:hypothetical protein|nr:hypothetical protein [Candidatus Neomarinimicrobiota bacterium]MBT5236719.1 hypothetical protein [Candidatus Neomarinimicrobiota bacterium]MBT6948080.1 hypothetical protein [Candidatus Neomarinimicrobiota bacterium]MBT7091495.1 hypothetical protein [Candidatus Neomarinimicrobiota bacterium]MBT7684183.1 hypothetical protein [Candidatus Neomarinimicrobiota bacterium]